MRYGIFADIHANLEAFQKVIELYKKESIDKYVCCGDIVGYGADAHACIALMHELDALSVCGNHDVGSIGLFDIKYFNTAARLAVEWTKERLTEEEKIFLRSLEFVVQEHNFEVTHSTLNNPELFDYIVDIQSAYECFQRMEKDVCFVGHTHRPIVFMRQGEDIRYTFDATIEIKPEGKYIVNVGSVGQPRDHDPRASFCIYDTDKKTVERKRVEYDAQTAKNKIIQAGLPEVLGYRLLEGW